jgi:hypothetical protein
MKKILKFNKIYSGFLLLTIITAVFNIGCGSEGYKKPITKFRDASAVVVEGTRIYISELNKVEREKYIFKQYSTRNQIKSDEIKDVQVFGEEGLQARIDALDALANYGDLLLKLANSDAPEKITAQATSLKGALEGLTGTVNGLTGSENKNFKDAIGPATVILGTILEAIAQQKIKEGLDKAILGAEKPINNLIYQIGIDLRSAYVGKQVASSATKRYLVDEYNTLYEYYDAEKKNYDIEKKKGDKGDVNKLTSSENRLISLSEKMKVCAENIREHENRWEELGQANPVEPLAAMASAHSALINYAKSRQKIGDFQSMVDSIDFFAVRAQQFGEAVRALSGLNS